MCNGKLLDVLAATANFSTFYGVCRGPALGLRVVVVRVAGVPGEGACPRSYLPPLPRCCWAMPMPRHEVSTSWTSWTMNSPTRHSSFLSTKASWTTW